MTYWYWSALLVIALDQLSKSFILGRLSDGKTFSIGGVILIAPRPNNEGIISIASRSHLLLFWVVTLLGILLLTGFVPQFTIWNERIALGIAFGGATSNCLDRLWRNAIVDFIDLRVWPVFNLADAAIVIGAALAVVFLV